MANTKQQLVYRFSEGNATMGPILGNKGAHLSEMTSMGIPVPPGFIITTEVCKVFYDNNHQLPDDLWNTIVEHMHELEQTSGKLFGSANNPLTVSVRSGAPVSMPGMMETILNLGLNDTTVVGLAEKMDDKRPALDAYRRFVQGFSNIVKGVESNLFEKVLESHRKEVGVEFDFELTPEDLTYIIKKFREILVKETGEDLPQDPWDQLRQGIGAVFSSWNIPRAISYREYNGIPHHIGTGSVVMAMAFGNLGETSGTGVLFTRNPSTGTNELFGEYLPNAQGEDVVAGIRTPYPISWLEQNMPETYQEIGQAAKTLELHYKDAQDVEFTVEQGKLYILQTRSAKRTPIAAVKIAVEMVEEGMINQEDSILRINPEDISQVLFPRFTDEAKENAISNNQLIATGLNASPGAATGKAYFNADRAESAANQGEIVILVRPETSPDDIHGILPSAGLLTLRGGITSHAAVVTRGTGKPCVVGCEDISFDETTETISRGNHQVKEGDPISIDGNTGEVFIGALEQIHPSIEENKELNILLGWSDNYRKLGVRGNADTPEDTQKAIELGAEGVGLCRTEHMFFDPERIPQIQSVLINAAEAQRLQDLLEKTTSNESNEASVLTEIENSVAFRLYNEALAALEEYQTEDFRGILDVSEGRPITIRLLDAPLHEFLPKIEDIQNEIQALKASGDKETLALKEELLNLVDTLNESNPMLGHRGCRLGITFPSIYDMQMRAILKASASLIKQGKTVRPEIMIPLAGHVNELSFIKERVRSISRSVEEEFGISVPFKFGTMIEVPRAAETADEMAEEAEFFSFGSNDLTQMTFAFSRDDAERKFLQHYQKKEILPANPFATLDRAVGKIMARATQEGRETNPKLSVGICGEHGGDPQSVEMCHNMAVDYVSASPFRIPVARLAAAQATLKSKKR